MIVTHIPDKGEYVWEPLRNKMHCYNEYGWQLFLGILERSSETEKHRFCGLLW